MTKILKIFQMFIREVRSLVRGELDPVEEQFFGGLLMLLLLSIILFIPSIIMLIK